jgi:hypothetical protein
MNVEERDNQKEKEREEKERNAREMNLDPFDQPAKQIATTRQEIKVTRPVNIKQDIVQKFGTQGALFTMLALLQVLMPSLGRFRETSHPEKIQPEGPKIVDDDDSKLTDKFRNPKNHLIKRNPKSSVTAYLSQLNDKNYRLDFKWRDTENVGTFILRKTGKLSQPVVL